MSLKSEYGIHSIIRNHPYFLGDEFENLDLKHEKVYPDGSRADFVFADNICSIVVEVKKGPINIEMLNQALRYLDNEKNENPQKLLKGVLVGSHLPKSLKKEIGKSRYGFETKLLDSDIPTKIKICDKCRRANALYDTQCRYCKSRKFITDPFLFL